MGARNHHGPIRKTTRRGKVIWVIDFFWLDKQGRKQRYRHDAQIRTREGALLEARTLQERAIRTGSLATRSAAPTLRAFVEGAFQTVKLPTFKPATRVRYQALLRQGLIDAFGSTPLDAISAGAVHAFAASLAKRGVNAKGPLMLLRTIVKAGEQLGLIDLAPVIPRLWKESRKLPTSPPTADVLALIAAAGGWLRVAIALAAFSGLRSGEVRGLEVGDIDFVGGRIHIRRAMSEDEVAKTKSGHERSVPIAPVLRPLLEEAVRGKLPKARVVATGRGRTPRRQHILTRLRKLERRVGIEEWTFHHLRHHFCTELMRGGANVEVVRRLAGHSSLHTTQRYVHEMNGDAERAVGHFAEVSR